MDFSPVFFSKQGGTVSVSVVHVAPRYIFLTNIACGLYRTDCAAEKRDSEECVDVLVKVEYACTLGCIKGHVANNERIHDIACHFFRIFAYHSIPVSMLFKIGDKPTYITHGNIVKEFIDLSKTDVVKSLAHTLSCNPKDWCEIITEHFGIIFDSCSGKRFCKGGGEIFALSVTCECAVSLFVGLKLNMSCCAFGSISKRSD